MKRLLQIFEKYKVWLLAFLKPMGIWGVGALAMIDAAAIPVPQDLILAGYVWADKQHFYVYVLISSAGSAIGGLIPFFLGRAGGELFLMKRVNRQRYEQMRDRFERQEFLAMMIPSILPPPTPWKLFVFCAGVFEMRTANFALAVFSGRILRNLIVAILTIRYGPRIVVLAMELAVAHRLLLLIVLVFLIGALVARALIKKRRSKVGGREEEQAGIGDEGSEISPR